MNTGASTSQLYGNGPTCDGGMSAFPSIERKPLAQSAARAGIGIPHQTAPTDDFHIRTGLVQQRRRFGRALPAADHHDAASPELRGVGMLARVAHQAARQAVELSGPIFVMQEPGRHDDAAGENILALFKDDAKAAVAGRHANDCACIEIGRHVMLEPRSVIDEILDRQELRTRQAHFAKIVVEPIAAAGLGNMRRNPRRTQLHAGRHVMPPKRHGLAEHPDRDIGGA